MITTCYKLVCGRRFTLAGLIIASAFAVSMQSTHAAIITDGDFSGGTGMYAAIPDWDQVPNPSGFTGIQYLSGTNTSIDQAWNNGKVPGAQGTTGQVGVIEMFNAGPGQNVLTLALAQTLTLVLNQQYELTYYENSRAGNESGITAPLLEVFLDAQSIVASHVVTPVAAPGSYTANFYTITTLFTATATSQVLRFQATSGNNVGGDLLLAQVSVTAVPEPGAVLMFAIGLVSIPFFRRHRYESN